MTADVVTASMAVVSRRDLYSRRYISSLPGRSKLTLDGSTLKSDRLKGRMRSRPFQKRSAGTDIRDIRHFSGLESFMTITSTSLKKK
jgi:hypothetical protein